MNIEQLKAANPIEQVAARYGSLRKAGANYKMQCPFHDDHHPSLILHVAKQFFKCHACGEGGDVIKLVMGLEKCSFTKAAEKLGKTTSGTHSRQPATPPSLPAKKPKVRHIREANQQFLQLLLPCPSGHSELSPTWLDFGVGCAPAFVPEAFRPMRGRIIFPVYDANGQLTGFGARRTETHPDSPKYINTANNGLFDKSRTLYGIHRAAEAIREAGFAYLVEGYKDVLAMHAAGLRNTVALCGTALTDGQAEILSSYTSRLHLLLDGDLPGRNAAEKIACQRKDCFSVRFSFIPSGEDPDELFRRLGRTDFRIYLRHLTAPGHFCARRLLAYCLRHPDAAPLLERMMEADDMPFADSDYKDLLHFLAFPDAPHDFPPELQPFAAFLKSLLPSLFPPLPDLPGLPEAMRDETTPVPHAAALRTLLTEYYEERIISEARILRRRLHTATPALRPSLFKNLHHQLRLLSAVTREAERTPAVGEKWF